MKKLLKKIVFVVLILLALPVGFILTLQVTEYRPAKEVSLAVINDASTQVSLNETLTLMTFNIGYASLGADEDFVLDGGVKAKTDSIEVMLAYLAGITELVHAHSSDLYLFQEIDVLSQRSYNTDQRAHFAEALPQYGHAYATNFRSLFVPFPLSFTQMIGRVESGIATYSQYHVSEATRIQLPGAFPWPVRLANLKRALLIIRLPISDSDKELVVINGHLSAYDDGSMRTQEMQLLKEIMEAEYALGNYVIVGGDFNQTFPEADGLYPIIDDENYVAPVIPSDFLPEAFSFVFDPEHPTCRLLNKPYNKDGNNQYYVIDGFIVSDNIEVKWVKTIQHDFLYSDHNPVTLSVTLIPAS